MEDEEKVLFTEASGWEIEHLGLGSLLADGWRVKSVTASHPTGSGFHRGGFLIVLVRPKQ